MPARTAADHSVSRLGLSINAGTVLIKSYGGWKQLLDPDRDPARPLQISKTSTIRAILRRFHDSRAAPPNAAKSALQSTLLKPIVATLSSDAASRISVNAPNWRTPIRASLKLGTTSHLDLNHST